MQDSPRSLDTDTIAAQATPPGRGGVGIIRLSGPRAYAIARTLCKRELPLQPRHAHFARFYQADGEMVDEGLVLYFPAPHSFTGEDVIELQGHGGPMVMAGLLQQVMELGARLARPGEFSERAFLNDKLDLAQAEELQEVLSEKRYGRRKERMELAAWVGQCGRGAEGELMILGDFQDAPDQRGRSAKRQVRGHLRLRQHERHDRAAEGGERRGPVGRGVRAAAGRSGAWSLMRPILSLAREGLTSLRTGRSAEQWSHPEPAQVVTRQWSCEMAIIDGGAKASMPQ